MRAILRIGQGVIPPTPCHYFFFKNLFIYLFLVVLGLQCCTGFSLVVLSGDFSVVASHRLLIMVVYLIVEHGL